MSANISLPLVIQEGSRGDIALRVIRAVAVVGVIFMLPYMVEPFRLGQVSVAALYAIVVVALNFLSGYGGQISLGHAAFFGLGAYVTGILVTDHDWSLGWALMAAVISNLVVGAVVAFPALRLKGIYVVLVTLAIGLIFPTLVMRFEDLTGGSSGLFGIDVPVPGMAYFSGFNGAILFKYWAAMLGLVLTCLVVRNLVRSRFGRSVIALRDNETVAIIMGVNRTTTRTLLFGTSAGLTGLAGGLFAVNTGLITPLSFSLMLTLYFLAGMVIGGTSSLWGPVIGGFAIYFIPVWASGLSSIGDASNWAGVVLGVIIILVMYTMRSGVMGLARSLARRVIVIAPRTPVAPASVRGGAARIGVNLTAPSHRLGSVDPAPAESSDQVTTN